MVRVLLSATLLLLLRAGALAQSNPLELKWDEFRPLGWGQRLELILDDGTSVKGQVVSIRDDSIVMDVRQSSGASAYGKGGATIARERLDLIKLERRHGPWAMRLAMVGVLATGVIGGLGSAYLDGGPAYAVIGASSMMPLVGYQAGKQLDRSITEIRIIP